MRLETDRLVLRQFRDDDLDALAELNADPEVMRYIGAGATNDREETVARFAALRRHWDDHGFGIFAVESRESGLFTGWVGLATPTFLPEVMPAVEIGWRLGRRWWGHGIATEAASQVLRFAFDDVGLDRLISIRHIDNVASGRVMEKLGFTFERAAIVPAHGQPVSVWELAVDTYRAQLG